MKNSEFIEDVITKYNFQEVCEIKAENNMPTFCYEGYVNNNGIYDQKESVYLWVIIENNRPIDVIYVGLIDKTTLKDILKHTILTHTQNNMNIEILEEKPLTQDEKDLALLQN